MPRFFVSLALAALGVTALGQQSGEDLKPGDVAVKNVPDNQTADFKIITPKGFVAFSVGGDWPVLAMQSKLPIAAAGFQIPNPADEGTTDSTNLAITLYDETSAKGHEALGAVGRAYGQKPATIDHRNNWIIYTQESKQGGTVYTVLDAKSKVADVAIAIRLAWPQLANNERGYDKEMRALFYRVLDSIHGSLGPYKPQPNDVIRRPPT